MLTSPKQLVRPARARKAGPLTRGGASAELGAAAARGSGSGLARGILAAAATAAAPGQVKRAWSSFWPSAPPLLSDGRLPVPPPGHQGSGQICSPLAAALPSSPAASVPPAPQPSWAAPELLAAELPS